MNADQDFMQFEDTIGYRFQDAALLRQAFTHSSFTNEHKINKPQNYERLEFLGDAVLEMITSDTLFHQYEEMSEGDLTRTRASLVCELALASKARELSLDQYVLLGKGEEATGGRNRDSIVADVVESLIGAIFIDGGIDEAESFIRRFVLTDIENNRLFFDSKTKLQEVVQKTYRKAIRYRILDMVGPEHDKMFHVEVTMGDKQIGKGSGHTKKAAEQEAAYAALLCLQNGSYEDEPKEKIHVSKKHRNTRV
jgi:ribonuclease-3